MPIFIKNLTWNQTEELITVAIPIKNCHASKCSIFTSSRYIKVHQEAYICEIFLQNDINNDSTSCTITDEGVTFCLHKCEAKLWPQFDYVNLTKEEKMDIRSQALKEVHQKAQNHVKKLEDEREKLNKEIIRENIKLNEKEMKMIERNKQKIIADAFKYIQNCNAIEKNEIPKTIKRFVPPKPRKNTKSVERVELPPMRSIGEIDVEFTPRQFPTPKRESQDVEEQEWLRKQAEARKSAGFCSEDLRPAEVDPEWIKNKGDSFLLAENYLGAEAAYSHAISLGSQLPSLYCNRAAAHLALGNLHKAIEDCAKALELLNPVTKQNATSRARCHVRRAAALCRLGCAKLALPDFEEAIKLQPNDEKLRQDLRTAQKLAAEQENEQETEN